jgi:hypothetical protein
MIRLVGAHTHRECIVSIVISTFYKHYCMALWVGIMAGYTRKVSSEHGSSAMPNRRARMPVARTSLSAWYVMA